MDSEQYLDITGECRKANPKLAGSGIVACRPQIGTCPGNCADCFFKGGRYYEDLGRPHVPHPDWVRKNKLLVRMNDGNDSNHMRELVIGTASLYDDVFFNTRIPCLLFPSAVVLTVNGDDTDGHAWLLPPDTPGFENLACVQFRANTWNTELAKRAIDHYQPLGVPVRLTYMAYYAESVREPADYEWRKRTLNSYWCILPEARDRIEDELGYDDYLIHACTRKGGHLCRECKKCHRMYQDWQEKRER